MHTYSIKQSNIAGRAAEAVFGQPEKCMAFEGTFRKVQHVSNKKKKSKSPTATITKEILAKFQKQSNELFKEHMQEVLQILEESEDRKIPLTFQVQIDCSETEPSLTTRIRFAQTVTDERTELLDDGKQGRLFGDNGEPKGKLEAAEPRGIKPKSKKSGKTKEPKEPKELEPEPATNGAA